MDEYGTAREGTGRSSQVTPSSPAHLGTQPGVVLRSARVSTSFSGPLPPPPAAPCSCAVSLVSVARPVHRPVNALKSPGRASLPPSYAATPWKPWRPLCRPRLRSAAEIAPGTQYCDLLDLGERQAPALQITAPPGPDTTGLMQDPAPGTPARIDRSHGFGDEIIRPHPGPKNLQEIRPQMN